MLLFGGGKGRKRSGKKPGLFSTLFGFGATAGAGGGRGKGGGKNSEKPPKAQAKKPLSPEEETFIKAVNARLGDHPMTPDEQREALYYFNQPPGSKSLTLVELAVDPSLKRKDRVNAVVEFIPKYRHEQIAKSIAAQKKPPKKPQDIFFEQSRAFISKIPKSKLSAANRKAVLEILKDGGDMDAVLRGEHILRQSIEMGGKNPRCFFIEGPYAEYLFGVANAELVKRAIAAEDAQKPNAASIRRQQKDMQDALLKTRHHIKRPSIHQSRFEPVWATQHEGKLNPTLSLAVEIAGPVTRNRIRSLLGIKNFENLRAHLGATYNQWL